MNIGVVGAGVAGLTAAYLLSKKHKVTLIEKEKRIGGHTNTINVKENGKNIGVDTGFIVLNDRNYPNFKKLLDKLEQIKNNTYIYGQLIIKDFIFNFCLLIRLINSTIIIKK